MEIEHLITSSDPAKYNINNSAGFNCNDMDINDIINISDDLESMKEIIVIPEGVRYIGSDEGWSNCAEGEKRYDLHDYPYPHILNKVLTGCGFTEYCIRNNMNIILCSPRKMLLENKEEQHPEINVLYARNEYDSGSGVNYEKTFTVSEGRKEINKKFFTILDALKNKKGPTPKEIEMAKQNIIDFKSKIKSHFMKCQLNGLPCKILVTYDSFRHVKEALQEISALDNFQVVVDEFQSILVDCKFKSDTELELMHHLSGIQKICYVSATPMLNKYLKRLDDFKDLPYYEFDWAKREASRIIKPNINVTYTDSVTNDLVKVIYSYKDGKFDRESWIDDTGKIQEIESREAVLYVNSVKFVTSMITKCELLPEDCNILIAKTTDNENKVRKAFNDVFKKLGLSRSFGSKDKVIGSVPTKGQPHKMFTFCTRTVYLGADFYSTNARTFIFCDSNIDCLSVDISMDLPQILGRQRLNENPWKNEASLYIKATVGKLTRDDFNKELTKKISTTNNLLNIYDKSNNSEKHDLAQKYERDAVGSSYKMDYISVNRHAGNDIKPVFNQLMLVSEIRAFDIQQQDYADRVSIFNTLKEKGFVAVDVEKELDDFKFLKYYHHKMEFVCQLSLRLTADKFKLFLNSIPKSFKNYYTILGPDKCKALMYQKGNLEREYQRLLNNQGVSLEDRIYDTFHAGDRLRKEDIKKMLAKIYQDSGYTQTAKATDIIQWFNTKAILCNNKETGKRDAGFELISRVTPPTP